MPTAVDQLDLLASEPAAALPARLRAALSTDADWLSAADVARQSVTRDVDWALRLSDALLAAAPADSPAWVRALAAKANALCYQGRPEAALDALGEARRRAAGLNARYELANAQLASVQPLFILGRLDEARDAACAAREEFGALGFAVQEAMAEVNLATVLRRLSQPRAALEHFDRARAILADDPVRRAMIDSNRAEALLDVDDYSESQRAFESALHAFESVQNHHAAALVEGNLADLFSRQGRPDDALRHFESARRRFEALGSETRAETARLRVEEAECLARLGAWRDSLVGFHEAFYTLEDLGFAYEAARCLLAEGRVHARMSARAEAERALRDAQRRFAALRDGGGQADSLAALAELAQREGRFAEADELLAQAAELSDATPSRAALIACERALLQLQAGRMEDARERAAAATIVAERLSLTPLLVRTEFVAGMLARAAATPEQALAHFRRAADLLERTHGALPGDRYRYAFLSDAEPLYEAYIASALEMNQTEAPRVAFEALERSSARGLLDLVAAGSADSCPGARSVDDQRILQELSECQSALHVAYSRLGLGTVDEADGEAAATDRLAALEARYEKLEARLLSGGRVSPVVARPLQLDELRQRLAADAAVVQYFREHDAYGALVIRKDTCHAVRDLCDAERIAAAVRRLTFTVEQAMVRAGRGFASREAGPQWDSVAFTLRESLVTPLLGQLAGATTIGIVPAGDLHALPLHALRDGDRFAFEDRAVTYLPSASIGAHLWTSDAAPIAAPRALAVGIDDEIAPGMRAEAEEVAALYRGASALLGPDATAGAFANAAADADIIHLATHSVFSEAHPSSSRIRLADRWLTAREVTRLRLPRSIVVLAGCETGRTAADTGRERFGLIRAFLAAGASAVLVSLWPLHDAVARILFSAVHKKLLEAGGTRSAARCLMEVQREFARRGTHPAFWSGLFVVGGTRS